MFVVKITVYNERISLGLHQGEAVLCLQGAETRYRSKHQGNCSLHKQAPLPTPLKDVGEVTHGNTTRINTAYNGAVHWENKVNILRVYFTLYIKLPVAT